MCLARTIVNASVIVGMTSACKKQNTAAVQQIPKRKMDQGRSSTYTENSCMDDVRCVQVCCADCSAGTGAHSRRRDHERRLFMRGAEPDHQGPTVQSPEWPFAVSNPAQVTRLRLGRS